jgi:hypothetical protein
LPRSTSRGFLGQHDNGDGHQFLGCLHAGQDFQAMPALASSR